MRALIYSIALASFMSSPSMAGNADRDMPGVGTFTYCGSPVAAPQPDLAAVDNE